MDRNRLPDSQLVPYMCIFSSYFPLLSGCAHTLQIGQWEPDQCCFGTSPSSPVLPYPLPLSGFATSPSSLVSCTTCRMGWVPYTCGFLLTVSFSPRFLVFVSYCHVPLVHWFAPLVAELSVNTRQVRFFLIFPHLLIHTPTVL
jgi:hypothetical protein